jgi:hypothetical protein
MNDVELDRFERINREEIERIPHEPPPAVPARQTIHYAELPEDSSNSPIAKEWNFYRREVGRLLAQGQEGKWVLITGEEVIGIWETQEQAYEVALQKYLMQPVLIHRVLFQEPILRGPTFFRLCHS